MQRYIKQVYLNANSGLASLKFDGKMIKLVLITELQHLTLKKKSLYERGY